MAGEDRADMVLPASVGAAFEVIEAKFALHVFVGAFDAPALLDDEALLFGVEAGPMLQVGQPIGV